jgi:hypothetical protein
MEVKFMCDRKAKVARRGIAACGRSFFRGDCCAVPVSGEAAQQALWRGVAGISLLLRNNFSRKDAGASYHVSFEDVGY